MNKFLIAINNLKRRLNPYTRIKSLSDFVANNRAQNKQTLLDMHDLSDADLRNDIDLLNAQNDGPFTPHGIDTWTTHVIWPSADKMPIGFNPQKILESAKHPTEMDTLHQRGITGNGINIAIIDSRLNLDHPEYADRIKFYYENENLRDDKHVAAMHGSLVCGCSVGKTTGTAPDANLYYFASANTHQVSESIIALQKVLEIQKSLPENDKIRILSCSWSPEVNATESETQKCMQLFQELEKSGIKVIYCNSNTGDFVPCDTFSAVGDKRKKSDNRIGIPTNKKTTPYFKGGYRYGHTNGDSAAAPYLAGVFACALQDNTIFCTRPGWQDELMDIMKRTAIDHAHGGKIINPTGIVDTVTQIAREMELNIIKQQANQHE